MGPKLTRDSGCCYVAWALIPIWTNYAEFCRFLGGYKLGQHAKTMGFLVDEVYDLALVT